MKRKQFKIIINASREKVWDVLWSDETYRLWTTPFIAGSYTETNWEEGGKVLFLGPGRNGMVSRIKRKIDQKFMSFEHLGTVKNGIEDTQSDAVKSWKGALENYTLLAVDGETELLMEVDIAEEYLDNFQRAIPKALQKVKELSE